MDDVLGCLLDVLDLRTMEPDRPFRFVAGGMALLRIAGGFSGPFLADEDCESRMLPSPLGEGNWVSLKSDDADSILACRSSKLTEGRKS